MGDDQVHAMAPSEVEKMIASLRPLASLLDPEAGYYRQLGGLEDAQAIRAVMLLQKLREKIVDLCRDAEWSLDDTRLLELLRNRERGS